MHVYGRVSTLWVFSPDTYVTSLHEHNALRFCVYLYGCVCTRVQVFKSADVDSGNGTPLQEQDVLFTTDPSVQPQNWFCFCWGEDNIAQADHRFTMTMNVSEW